MDRYEKDEIDTTLKLGLPEQSNAPQVSGESSSYVQHGYAQPPPPFYNPNQHFPYQATEASSVPDRPGRRGGSGGKGGGSSSSASKKCAECDIDTTPLWRKGPAGPRTLCNACGLRHIRELKKQG